MRLQNYISVPEEKPGLVIEAKRGSIGWEMRQSLLLMRDIWGNSDAKEYLNIKLQKTRNMTALFEGMSQARQSVVDKGLSVEEGL